MSLSGRSRRGLIALAAVLLDFFLLLVLLILPARAALAQLHWPQFRGPGGSGVSPDGDIPVRFGPDRNAAFKVPLPPGHSSPCVAGERLFLTGHAEGLLVTFAIDRRQGKVLWSRGERPEKIESGSRLSSPAASTPTADETRVYVYFAAVGLIAYGHDGQEAWRKPLPVPITGHGASTSPVLAGDRLLLACDQDVGSHLLAVDRRTGETLWRAERPGFRRGFSTPLVWPPEAPRAVVLPGSLRVVAYDLRDGAERWSARGLPNEMVTTPVAGDGLIFTGGWTYGSGVETMPAFATLLEPGDRDGDGQLTSEEAPAGPARQHFRYIDADKDGRITRSEWDSIAKIFDEARNTLLAVRPDGEGDVTETHVVWRQTRGLPYVPSPLFYGGRLFLIRNGGIASAFEARSGRAFYQEKRIEAGGEYYSSPVAAGGKICVASIQGVVTVLKAGDELEVLARNELGEPILATPAIAGRKLYVRTEGHLYAFEEPEGE
ncbi:MAG: PQQ-binding-like beta-propeller repeat protein [Planctomycetes bacterium]|nr:PQQ-binding-like beta-propeller repeat protein [Planctomycetota bacterium]